MTNQDTDSPRWYQVKIVWLVFGIPAMTVAGCMLTIYLALTNPDPVLDRSPTQPVKARMQ